MGKIDEIRKADKYFKLRGRFEGEAESPQSYVVRVSAESGGLDYRETLNEIVATACKLLPLESVPAGGHGKVKVISMAHPHSEGAEFEHRYLQPLLSTIAQELIARQFGKFNVLEGEDGYAVRMQTSLAECMMEHYTHPDGEPICTSAQAVGFAHQMVRAMVNRTANLLSAKGNGLDR